MAPPPQLQQESAREGLRRQSVVRSVSSECSQLEVKGAEGGTSQLSERLQDMITFHTMHKNTSTTYCPHPSTGPSLSLSLSLSLFPLLSRLKPRSSLLPRSVSRFLSPASPLPAVWRYTHAPTGASFLLTFGAPGTSCPGSGGQCSAPINNGGVLCVFFFFFWPFVENGGEILIGLFHKQPVCEFKRDTQI